MEYITYSLNQAIGVSDLGYIAMILFAALMLRAAIGFGDGLLAVPLLTLFIDLQEAVPLVLLLGSSISIVALWQERQCLQLGSLGRTSVAALLGIPLGVMLLSFGNEDVIKGFLGLLLITMAIWKLLPMSSFQLQGPYWSYLFGGLAGILGSAYALRGVVFSIYGGLRGWNPGQFKSTISGFYILSGILIPITYFSAGLITPKLIGLYLLLLPLAILSTFIGGHLTKRLNADLFQRVIWIFMFLFGVLMIVKSML
jgi:hypothetical protein